MTRSSSSYKSETVLSSPAPSRPKAEVQRSPRQGLPVLAAGAAVILIGAAVVSWQVHQRAAPAPPRALALPPLEARLLKAARRQPANPQPFLELAEEYAASSRP